MKITYRNLLLSPAVIFCFLIQVRAQTITITPDKTNGIYQSGETVTWTIHCNPDSVPDSLHYKILKGQLTDWKHGMLKLSDGIGRVQYKFEMPGSVLLEVHWTSRDSQNHRVVGGAMASPEKFELSAKKPKDFDKFWAKKVKELEAVPPGTQLEKEESGNSEVDYWKITMNNIRGTHIHGQLARPVKGDKFPALLIVQWAGVYPLHKSWAVDRAKNGWLVLNIEAHDLPIDKPEDFYKDQFAGPLKNYWAIGNDGRETSYFLRMYLSCYRAAEYLTKRPDWNGKTLVVMGDSQGGQQTLMTAGFFPGITAAIALVPAGFDMLGPDIGRKGGWPQWYDWTQGKDPASVHEASRYYDVSNFVTRIKCPVLVGVGLIDETCPPEGILAGLDQISTPKEIMILPRSGHQNINGSQKAFEAERDNVWLPALRKGEKAPVNNKLNGPDMRVLVTK